VLDTTLPALFWLLSFGAIAWMFVKFREAQRVLVNANPAAHLTDLDARLQIARDELTRSELARQQLEPTKIELEQLQLRRQAILDEISSLEGQKQNLLQELQRLDPERQELEQTRQAHANAMEELADARQKHSDLLTQVEVNKAVLAGLLETKSQAELAVAQSEVRQSELTTKNGELTRQNASLEIGLDRLSTSARQLADQCEKSRLVADELEQRVRSLTNEHQQLEAHNTRLKQDNAVLDTRLAETRQRLQVIDQQLTEKAARLELAKVETTAVEAKLSKAREELTKSTESRDKANEEFKKLNEEVEGLKVQRENYLKMIETLREDYAKKGGIAETDVTKALEDLAQPVLGFNFAGQANLDEKGALQRFSEYLVSKGLKYPERVQRAFHTSLKASQINPLVVLAGVSGTGKSALPMAYAEALGINFVSLAVQPGWSGPQDLLGFYNYLERKYKATELARAMAQMSRYSHEDLPGLNIKTRKDQMLLVLLDEMNLARIEYYFSEFLSRLEQRRGRNLSDAQRRREVALHLDIGSLPANEASRFIFPDLNVLFVGTMNEDESTQSLSDKVVDRANVLRFGAPKDLHAPTTKPVTLTNAFLPRTSWEGWVKAFDGNALQEERKLLSEINAQLEKINRPFGHRVFRAILDYISNYPGALTDSGRRAHALADQIEQKIIPKLRGLETQGQDEAPCLDYLAVKIADLRDSELRDAFERARGGHMFEWHGVKRS